MKDMHFSSKTISNFLNRFHLVLFIVVVMLSLSVAVILLYSIVGKASGAESTALNGNGNAFDQATIDRIEQLKTSDQPSTPLDFSKGRINPFNE